MRWRLRVTGSMVRLLVFVGVGLVTTLGMAWLMAATVDVEKGPSTAADAFVGHEHWTITRHYRAGATQIHSVRRVGLNWSPQQAAGAPDTPTAGDKVTAWASLGSDTGTEWLICDYANAVIPRELHVYENCAPGALFRVTAYTEEGKEVEAWAGTDPTPVTAQMGTSKVPLKVDFKTKRVRIYLACDKVPGWNEVDAVGLVDSNGQTQWARRVMASSTYATVSSQSVAGSVSPQLLVPTWCDLDQPGPAMQSGDANFEDRIVDARGWPMLALYSDRDHAIVNNAGTPGVTALGLSDGSSGPPNPGVRISGRSLQKLTAVSAVTTPTSGGPVPLPVKPIWSGLVINTLIYAAFWWVMWLGFTVPRRWVREVGRFRRGCCPECGYDLGYDFLGGCPECGWRRERAMEKGRPQLELMVTAGNGNGASGVRAK